MKKSSKIVLSILVVLLVAVLSVAVVFFFYSPRYVFSKKTYDVGNKEITQDITVMSFNVRCVAPKDLFKKSWFYRADLVIETISSNSPDVIGFQEVTPMHEKFLKKHLSGYSFNVAYRTAKGVKEGVMIAYRNDRFTCLDEGRFWLSETPEVESKSWDTAFPRVLNYVKLSDKKTGKNISVLDTHLDHVSAEARSESMKVIMERSKTLDLGSYILMGDMNDYPSAPMYKTAIDGGLVDALLIAQKSYVSGGSTFHGFGKYLTGDRIDYFFLTPDFTVSDYKVVDVDYNGVYPSDHFPLVINITQ